MKLLTGITIPAAVETALAEVKQENKHLQAIKWSKPKDYHITTYYLGEVDPIQLDAICSSLAQVTQNHHPLKLPYKKIGFSPGKNPNMLWAYFKLTPEFQKLCNEIALVLDTKMPARYKPIPHIKLASLKKSHRYYSPHFEIDVPPFLEADSLCLWGTTETSFKSIKMFPLG
jgi:2'-5' RNA ligase